VKGLTEAIKQTEKNQLHKYSGRLQESFDMLQYVHDILFFGG